MRVNIRPGTSDVECVTQVWNYGEYQPAVKMLSEGSISSHPVIVDAGAYIGATSLYLLDHFPFAYILAIEPDRENYDMLCVNLNEKRIWKRQWALWDTPGWGHTDSPPYDSRLWSKNVIESHDDNDSIRLVTMDQVIHFLSTHLKDEFKGIDLLKLDIEGTERFIFDHHYTTWLDQVKYIVMEIHERQFPGTKDVVEGCLYKNEFNFWNKGETTFAVNRKLVKS